jgi:proline iminopeptidase
LHDAGPVRTILGVPALTAPDGTRLSYDVTGAGSPVVCLPGGPMQDCAHLGDLGGLSRHLQLVLWDYRGTGRSETPADASSYRCDRLVDDVEALREHLDLDRMTLLAHSGGANLAVLYAARHPERLDKLVLVTPSTRAVDIPISAEQRGEIVQQRIAEPWFPAASAAFDAIQTEQATESDWEGITPLTYGRWDAAARAHHQRENDTRNDVAAAAFGAEGAFDPPATRAALAALASPVLLLTGEVDVAAPPGAMAEYADLFLDATFVVQPGAGHLPWLDDAAWFSKTVATFVG